MKLSVDASTGSREEGVGCGWGGVGGVGVEWGAEISQSSGHLASAL